MWLTRRGGFVWEGLPRRQSVAYPPCVQGFTRRAAMRSIRLWVGVAAATGMGLFLFVQRQVVAKLADERKTDREAISAVLSAQQTAWNHGDVDALLVGYWLSPDLTFSGSSGVARGWGAVLARYKKNYPDRAAMGQLNFSDSE